MGLFDLFKGGGKKADKAKPESDKAANAAKWAEKAGDKRAQNYDRQEALANLAEMGTAESAAALLKRFTFTIDPSITDQEEKDGAYNGILYAGKEAIEPVRAFAAKADSLAWPMKILKDLLDTDAYIDELLLWLSRWDTEYAKFIDPKLQILKELYNYKHEKIRVAIEPFLEDVNEEARFDAVATLLKQEDAAVVPALLRGMAEEESFRIKNKIADGLLVQGWVVPEDVREQTRKVLPPGYTIDAEGKLKKRG